MPFLLVLTYGGGYSLCRRFSIFRRHHCQFISLNVLQNNLHLDPAAASEGLVMKMTDLARKISRRHPGVNCVFRVSTARISTERNLSLLMRVHILSFPFSKFIY